MGVSVGIEAQWIGFVYKQLGIIRQSRMRHLHAIELEIFRQGMDAS
jgi:hypothetical protein